MAGEQGKQAKPGRTLPESDPAYDSLSLEDLRTVRAALAAEETRISYWRRLVQARVDVLRGTSGQDGADTVKRLTRVLTDVGNSRRRVASVSVSQTEAEIPPLPDLLPLWNRVVDSDDEAGREALISDLIAAEAKLSEFRSDLHRRIDAVTAQLILRLRADPMLALSALPGRGPLG